MKKLTDKYFDTYTSILDVDFDKVLEKVKLPEWTAGTFCFYTAVSVMSSSRIVDETKVIGSCLKHKIQDIEYLSTLTEKPHDLHLADEFARDDKLNLTTLLHNFYCSKVSVGL
jgi:hypothetical protein